MAAELSPFCQELSKSPAYWSLVGALGVPVKGYTSVRWVSNPFAYPDVQVLAEMCEIWCTPRVVATHQRSNDEIETSPQFIDLETALVWLKVEGWI